MCKKMVLTGVLLIGILFLTGTPARAVTIYTDLPSFLAAISAPVTIENFDDAVLNPGLGIAGPNVVIPYAEPMFVFAGQTVMRDQINDALLVPTTAFTFLSPINAFGGFFDLNGPSGPGSNIEVTLDGVIGLPAEIPNTTAGTFWGFVSPTLFSSVTFKEGSNGASFVETYDLDDLHYGRVPEPATLLLLGSGLAGLGLWGRRKLKSGKKS